MLNHILTASHEELQAEAERISLLDEPDREEAILELLEELQFKQEMLVWYEAGDEDNDFDDDDLEFGTDEDSWDPSTAEREDHLSEMIDGPMSDDPWSV